MTPRQATGWAKALHAILDSGAASGRYRRARALRFLQRHGTRAQRRALLDIQRLQTALARRRFWKMRNAREQVDPKFLNRGERERRYPKLTRRAPDA